MGKRQIIIFIMIFLLLFSSCTLSVVNESEGSMESSEEIVSNASSESSEISEQESVIDNSENSTNENYRLINIYDFYLVSPIDSIFKKKMVDNPIDKIVFAKYEIANKTDEIVGAAVYELNLWKEEMEFTIENLKEYLTEDEVEEFDVMHEQWINSVNLDMNFDLDMFYKNTTWPGTELRYLFPATKASLYKERVIKIKYINYIIEDNLWVKDDDCKSLIFKNNYSQE